MDSARSPRAQRIQMCICSEAVSLRAWSALVGLVVSRTFCETQAPASCVHACLPQVWLRALPARLGRGNVQKQAGSNDSAYGPES